MLRLGTDNNPNTSQNLTQTRGICSKGPVLAEPSQIRPISCRLNAALRRKTSTKFTETPFKKTSAVVVVTVSREAHVARDQPTLSFTTGLISPFWLCMATKIAAFALLSPSCSALKSSALGSTSRPAYAGSHTFQGPGSERNLFLTFKRESSTQYEPAPAAIACIINSAISHVY